MRMNAGIIMAGQQPDFAQSYGQGYQLGRQNAFKTLAEQYGAKAMEGDKEALNAFAAFDPQMGMGLAASRQNMDVQSERLQMARAEAARAAERHALTMGATERKMQAEKIGRGLATVVPAIQSGNLEAVNQQLRTFGMDPVGSIDDARLLVAQYDGAYEAFTRVADMTPKPDKEPESIRALRIRAEEAGLTPGTPAYSDFMQSGGKKAESRIIMGPEGQPMLVEGGAADNFKFTEGQSKDNVYATRAEGALSLLDSVGAEQLSSRGDRVLGAVPLGVGREFQNEDFQVAEQAGDEFLQAILRKDTGAAITEPEQNLYGKTYLPQPGDGPKVIEAKRQARIRAVEALKAGMNIQQITVTQRALVQAAERAGVGNQQDDQQEVSGSEPPAFLSTDDRELWQYMTPDERKAVAESYQK